MRGQDRRDLAPGGPAANPHQVTVLVGDLDRREPAEVEHDPAVVGAEAGEAVTAATYRQRPPGAGREPEARLHVADVGRAQHDDRAAVGQGRAARPLIGRLAWFEDVAAEVTAEDRKC